MKIALWVIQIVLAILYVSAGLWKITGEGPMLEKMMPGFSLFLIRLVGLGEALAGFGLILPAIVRRWTAVGGWASAVLALEACVFVIYHLLHKAYIPAGATLALGLFAAFLAWKRLRNYKQI